MEVCPNCGENSVVRDLHLGGQPRCQSCFWTSGSSEPLDYKSFVITMIRWGGIITLVAVFAFVCMQFVKWGQYSFDATFLMVKQYSGVAEEDDYLELGAICNAIKNRDCAVKYFKKVVDTNPRQKQALANLGINYALNGNWQEAKSHIEGYFSLGGNGYDVLLWYGRILNAIDGEGASIDWSYLALASKPTYIEAAEELIKQLRTKGRYIEALSVIGGMSEGHPGQESVWSDEFQSIQAKIQGKIEVFDKEMDSFQLSKVKGRHFYIPVNLLEGRSIKLFAIDKAIEELWIDEDFIYSNQISIPVDAPTHSLEWAGQRYVGRELILSKLYIGPWSFSNVKAVACGKCPFIFGAEPLSRVSYKIWSRHQTEFLTVRLKK